MKKSLLTSSAEMARCFGSDATPSAILNVVKRQVRPAVKKITESLKSGGDPKTLALMESLWTSNQGAPGTTLTILFLFESLSTFPSV